MQYLIYVNDNYEMGFMSFEDAMCYIIDNSLSIHDEIEDLDEHIIKVYCMEA